MDKCSCIPQILVYVIWNKLEYSYIYRISRYTIQLQKLIPPKITAYWKWLKLSYMQDVY